MAKIMQLIRSTDAAISRDLASGLDAELSADPIPLPDLLSRNTDAVARFLDGLNGAKMRLEADIASRTEELRQTEIAIAAYEAAQTIIQKGREGGNEA